MVAMLLFLSALRIGPRATIGTRMECGRTLTIVAAYQIALPLIALGLAIWLGVAAHPLAFAVILMLAAPSVTGSPNFSAIMGHDPAPPMRLLILGTALFPLTLIPVLGQLPAIADPATVTRAALQVLGVIAAAVAGGFALRRIAFHPMSNDQRKSVDGASAIVLGVVVVGLMSALGPALRNDPATVALWLAAAFAVNFGLQIVAYAILKSPGESIVAGNRNIALFLVALPPEQIDPILIFIGCYQIPMYLTPMVMPWLYGRGDPD